MRKPIAVLISDIHFTPATLELATTSLNMAMDKASELSVPLVIAGDTLDSKAIIRGECANRLIEMFEHYAGLTYVLVGNHDLLNEKSKEHSLNFLKPYVNVIDSPFSALLSGYPAHFIPYQSSKEDMQAILDEIAKGTLVIAHQGVQTAFMGHYTQDKTSLAPEIYADFRVISGHYHRAQDIKCGRPRKGAVGLFSYIGNPYSLTFGEANDGPKGFQVLYDDGLMEQVPTNQRSHVVLDVMFEELNRAGEGVESTDLIWLKVRGTQSQLDSIEKVELGKRLFGHANFKLDKVVVDVLGEDPQPPKEDLTDAELIDGFIDSTGETYEQKMVLKKLWREVIK